MRIVLYWCVIREHEGPLYLFEINTKSWDWFNSHYLIISGRSEHHFTIYMLILKYMDPTSTLLLPS